MKYYRSKIATIIILFAVLAGIGFAAAQIGRFTPTHAIVEPVYCGACHPDQIVELNATTHLPHFSGAVIDESNAIAAGNPAAKTTQAEAISGGCMMCHNTWDNRGKIFLTNFSLTDLGNNNSQISYNDINVNPTNSGVKYNVAITSTTQFTRLGGNVSGIKVVVQDPGTSILVAGAVLGTPADYTANTTGVLFVAGANTTALNGTGSVKITYKTGGNTVSYKDAWGMLSALSPKPGYFLDDQTGAASCGNPEKALCHAVEITVGKNQQNQLQENTAGANGTQLGSGNGIYFQHDMSYTSAQYAAKQVKLCAVCHVDKLPPMDADGNPLPQVQAGVGVLRLSHGVASIDTTGANATIVTSPDWAHRQVQCIRCHSHAGIGSGVQSN
jgi:hypothetical protein